MSKTKAEEINGVKIDKILVSVLQRRFKSITQEMSHAITRTTRSPILCEAKDFVTGLYDGEGKMLEQTENLPILSFSLGPVCEYIVNYFGDDIYPGDVIMHNDVFSLGNQNNDVAVYKPIFVNDKLVAWAACKGHQADIGGAVAGGYNPDATEVWQEALRIPPVKIYEKGQLRKDVWNMIFANIRLDIVPADITAQIGSCTLAERRMVNLIEKYGLGIYETHKEYLYNSTEAMMKAEIKTIPNGVYEGESTVYYDGKNVGSTYQIRVKITVEDENITFDFSNTDAQTPAFVNGTFTSSASAVMLTFLQMVNPDIPHNDGMPRPVKMIIPEGTIINAAFPAATTFGNHLCPQIADAIIRALAPTIPERVTAGWNHLLCGNVTGIDPRKGTPYVDILFLGMKGGSGGTHGFDGYDHIGMIDASGGVLAQDYEMFELQDPHLLIRHEYLCDSAGAGRWRGGLGVETEFAINAENAKCVIFGDGDIEPAFGLYGGMKGSLNRIEIRYPDGKVHIPRSKELVPDVPSGTIWFQHAGGGGGYGDPTMRPVDRVLADVKNGVVSVENAREHYRVIIDEQTGTVDEKATTELRKSSK